MTEHLDAVDRIVQADTPRLIEVFKDLHRNPELGFHEVRTARKSTVKEIQSYLDRVDAAWKLASDAKGVVNDI